MTLQRKVLAYLRPRVTLLLGRLLSWESRRSGCLCTARQLSPVTVTGEETASGPFCKEEKQESALNPEWKHRSKGGWGIPETEEGGQLPLLLVWDPGRACCSMPGEAGNERCRAQNQTGKRNYCPLGAGGCRESSAWVRA